jgi:hypothetical protein
VSVSVQSHAEAAAPVSETASLATLDLFALGRRAVATRAAHHGTRGFLVRARQLVGQGADGDSWRGPRDAAEAYIDEADVTGPRGLRTARAAGVNVLLGGGDHELCRAAAELGMRIVWRVEFANGETDAEWLGYLDAVKALGIPLAALMPVPHGEPYGLDTLRVFAFCRLALPDVPHLLADVTTLGPRLAQMAFGFGADELFGPIVAERALRLGDNAHNPALTRKEAATLLRGAGLTPHERFADGTSEEVTP